MIYYKLRSSSSSARAQGRFKFEDETPEHADQMRTPEIYDQVLKEFVFFGPCTCIKVTHQRLLQRE